MSEPIEELEPFCETKFRQLSENMAELYMGVGEELLDPTSHDQHWLFSLYGLKSVMARSVPNLDDSDLPAVNYCRFTIDPLAAYHEICTRLLRELRGHYNGRGIPLTAAKLAANAREFQEVRKALGDAWMRDMEEGEKAKARAEARAIAAAASAAAAGNDNGGGGGGAAPAEAREPGASPAAETGTETEPQPEPETEAEHQST